MKGEQLLLKMSTKGIEIGKPFGGRVVISAMDVAGSLAGLSRPAYLYAQVVYLGDNSGHMEEELVDHASRVACLLACKEHWRTTRQLLVICAHLAVIEHKHPGRCKACNGAGQRMNAEDGLKTCGRCNGSGRRWITSEALGRALGVSRIAAMKTWQYRYYQVSRELCSLEQEIARHLLKKFYLETESVS